MRTQQLVPWDTHKGHRPDTRAVISSCWQLPACNQKLCCCPQQVTAAHAAYRSSAVPSTLLMHRAAACPVVQPEDLYAFGAAYFGQLQKAGPVSTQEGATNQPAAHVPVQLADAEQAGA